HRDADDVVALLEQQRGGDRRVDAPGQGGQHPHPNDLTRSTAAGTARSARSTSRSVELQPSERRSEPRARPVGTPIAASTCEGSWAPEAHEAAADTIATSGSSRNSRGSDSTPSMHTCSTEGSTGAAPSGTVRTRPGTVAARPSA